MQAQKLSTETKIDELNKMLEWSRHWYVRKRSHWTKFYAWNKFVRSIAGRYPCRGWRKFEFTYWKTGNEWRIFLFRICKQFVESLNGYFSIWISTMDRFPLSIQSQICAREKGFRWQRHRNGCEANIRFWQFTFLVELNSMPVKYRTAMNEGISSGKVCMQ